MPDPTVLTTEQLIRTVEALSKRVDVQRDGDMALVDEQINSLRRELDITQRQRLELKADNEKALSTALEAAEKAVQAALAAAEKARDQQAVASQLATTKSENAFAEQLSQQSATFTLAISNLEANLTDVKGLLREQRAADRGQREQMVTQRDSDTDKRGGNTLITSVVGIGLTVLIAVVGLILSRPMS